MQSERSPATLRAGIMPRRRQSLTKSVRDRASEKPRSAKDMAARVTALEDICTSMKCTLDVQLKRIAAIQAHLDHVTAKVSGR